MYNTTYNILKKNLLFFQKNSIFIILFLFSITKIPLLYNGYPIINNLDEPYVINAGLRILNNFYYYKTLDPEFYDWGSFPLYVSALINSLLIFSKFIFFNTQSLNLQETAFSIERVDFVIANRFFSLILMNISILILYFFCKKNFNLRIAFLTSIIVILSPNYFYQSSVSTIDHWNLFYSSIIIYLSFEINKNFSKINNIFIYGIVYGVSLATKYTNVFLGIPFIIILLQNIRNKFLILKYLSFFFLSSLVIFFVLMPFFFYKYDQIFLSILHVKNVYSSITPGSSEFSNSYFLLLKNFFSMNFINTLISIIFLSSFFFVNKKKYLFLFLYPLILFIFFGFYVNFNMRNIISAIPFISILASLVIDKLIIKFSFKKVFFILIIFYLPVIKINFDRIKKSFLLDTRYVSLIWVENNLSYNDKILVGHYGPPLQDLKNFINTERLWFIHDLKKDDNSRAINSTVKYIILSSYEFSRYFNKNGDLIEKYKDNGELYKSFFDNNNLVKSFNPEIGIYQGPEIRVYLNRLYVESGHY